MNNDNFFLASDGTLCRNDAALTPLRANFARHFLDIDTGAKLRATLRAGEWAWPGGYQCFFYTSDGAALCFDCVRAHFHSVLHSVRTECNDGWRVIHLDCDAGLDEPVHCDHCNKPIGPDAECDA